MPLEKKVYAVYNICIATKICAVLAKWQEGFEESKYLNGFSAQLNH